MPWDFCGVCHKRGARANSRRRSVAVLLKWFSFGFLTWSRTSLHIVQTIIIICIMTPSVPPLRARPSLMHSQASPMAPST